MKITIHWLFWVVFLLSFFYGAYIYFFALLFAVVVHECGHCIVAKHYGLVGQKLSLLPFGAMVEIDCAFLPKKQRVIILLSGAITNFIWCLLFAVMIWLFPILFISFEYLVVANFLVGALNLLPLPTFDGWKIFFPKTLNNKKTFVSKFRTKTGKIIEIMLNGNETLFDCYKLVDEICPTKFVYNDKFFYEKDLEDLLLKCEITKKIAEC